jgi:hypothetical protein
MNSAISTNGSARTASISHMLIPKGFPAPPLVDFAATAPYISTTAEIANQNSNLQRLS